MRFYQIYLTNSLQYSEKLNECDLRHSYLIYIIDFQTFKIIDFTIKSKDSGAVNFRFSSIFV